MREATGNIWDYRSSMKVIPVNLGWTKYGWNVMGRGLAQQAKERYWNLPKVYGKYCCEMAAQNRIYIIRFNDLLLFPVKPLNKSNPHLSWMQPANLELIEESTKLLSEFFDREILVPLVGCGNGRLSESEVLPVLHKYLTNDRFILIRNNPVD